MDCSKSSDAERDEDKFKNNEFKMENKTLEYEDTNQNLLDIRYDIKVELDEELGSYLTKETDWCIQNDGSSEVDFNHTVDYGDLLKYTIFKCMRCSMIFTNRYQSIKHNLSHLKLNLKKLPIFECNDCSIPFLLRKKLISHINKSHMKTGNKQIKVTKMLHQCSICCKILNYKSWHAHMREVHGKRRFKCEICNNTFKAARFLKRHVTLRHIGVPRIIEEIKCSLCPSILKTKYALKTHFRNCHDAMKYPCDICKLVFSSRPYLFTHLYRRHKADAEEFVCNLCSKKFKWLQMLKIHKSSNHGRVFNKNT